MESVFVHPRVHKQHKDIHDEDVLAAWEACICARPRLDKNPSEYIAVGVDAKGRLLELVALCSVEGDWLIYHAKTPPTKKTLNELGLSGGTHG